MSLNLLFTSLRIFEVIYGLCTVIVHNAEEGGYWVEVPSLPGCFSQGETIDEALSNVREAIEVHIQGLKDDGQDVPKDESFVIGRVEIKAA